MAKIELKFIKDSIIHNKEKYISKIEEFTEFSCTELLKYDKMFFA